MPDPGVPALVISCLAVVAIAVEMERVGEGQRFVSKLLADRAADQSRIDGSPPGSRAITQR